MSGEDRSPIHRLNVSAVLLQQFFMPPACHTQSLLQPHHRQPLVWRACPLRAPVTLPMQSPWSRLLYPRAPQTLPCTCLVPLAHLGTLSLLRPILPYHLLGNRGSLVVNKCHRPGPEAAQVLRPPSPAVVLPPPPSYWLETGALPLPWGAHPHSYRSR